MSRTRYSITFINRHGLRTLVGANHSRYFQDTAADAHAHLRAMRENNSKERLESLFGSVDTLAVSPFECYDHGEAVGIYAESTVDAAGTVIWSCDIIKTCSCGKLYSAETWSKLEHVGEQEDDGSHIELRNCTCGSTIAIALSGDGILVPSDMPEGRMGSPS